MKDCSCTLCAVGWLVIGVTVLAVVAAYFVIASASNLCRVGEICVNHL